MNSMITAHSHVGSSQRVSSSEAGFTLLETAVALVLIMVIALGAAALFAYSTTANSNATDRELAKAVAQKRLEYFRTVPFTVATRNVAYSYPNGGLGATAANGVTETETSSGRSYTVVTKIQDTSVVPVGQPDAGQPTVKTITIRVTPQAGTVLGSVTLSTQRTTLVPGSF